MKLTTKKLSFYLIPWLVWGCGTLFVLYQFLLQTSPSVMISGLVKAYSIDDVQIGFLSSLFFYTYIILQIPAGILVDKFGARRILIISITICCLACLQFAFSKSLLNAQFARLLMGFACAPAVVCALYLASKWFPAHRFALIVGLSEMLGMIGGAIGEEALSFSVNNVGWRITMIFCAIMGLIILILVCFIVKNNPKELKSLPITNCNKIQCKTNSVVNGLFCIMKIPQAWLIGSMGGLLFAVLSGFAALWCVPYLQIRYNTTLTMAASASSMMFWGAAIGSPLSGWFSDYLKNRKIILLLGSIFSLILSLIIIYINSIPLTLMFILLFLMGFFSGAYVIPFAMMSDIISKQLHGTAMGFTNMLCILIGAPILQPLIGFLLEINQPLHGLSNKHNLFSLKQYVFALNILPIIFVITIFLLFFIKETYPKSSNI